MEKYSPEEVKELIAMLKEINSKVKKPKGLEPSRLEKQIKYLEQRYNFFNPTKEMLGYIIRHAEKSKSKLDSCLLQKLREEFAKKLK